MIFGSYKYKPCNVIALNGNTTVKGLSADVNSYIWLQLYYS